MIVEDQRAFDSAADYQLSTETKHIAGELRDNAPYPELLQNNHVQISTTSYNNNIDPVALQ
jgi:hypothetical protein